MAGFTSKIVVASIFVVMVLVAVPAPAAAHDGGCLVSTHVGPAKLHVQCDSKNHDDDSSGCLLGVNAGPVHKRVC